ncbi:MAG: 3-phosphoshikimate 1-carboxyvinyltransferase, partial [Candidatus Altarchaeaceae archaeon]
MEISRKFLKGIYIPPASKSYSHRAIICASLANGTSEIENYLKCDDVNETIETLKRFGAKFEINDRLIVYGIEKIKNKNKIKIDTIKFSGSTLRFLIPVACSLNFDEVEFIIKGRLRERPIDELLYALKNLGAEIYKFDDNISKISKILIKKSKLKGGRIEIPGNISSQYISGLLMACPLIE